MTDASQRRERNWSLGQRVLGTVKIGAGSRLKNRFHLISASGEDEMVLGWKNAIIV